MSADVSRQETGPVPPLPPAAAEEAVLRLYLALRSQGGSPAEIADRAGIPPEDFARRMSALAQLRLLEPPGPSGQLVTLDPDTALVRLFEAYEHRVQTQIDELVRLQQSAETLVHTFRPAIMRQNLEVEVDVLHGELYRPRSVRSSAARGPAPGRCTRVRCLRRRS